MADSGGALKDLTHCIGTNPLILIITSIRFELEFVEKSEDNLNL